MPFKSCFLTCFHCMNYGRLAVKYLRSMAGRRSRRWPYRLVDLGQGKIVNGIRIHLPSTTIADHVVRGSCQGSGALCGGLGVLLGRLRTVQVRGDLEGP